MILRPSRDTDNPAIIELLKVSLGESLIPKSEILWTWKHVSNPFGKSPVLLAEENGILVGVRAFLRWEFVKKGKVIKACRAVDTATHPHHQGKGIFQKLTLEQIEELKNEKIDLIFNTPNSKSTPGYLKMGWEKWGKLPLKLNFHLGNNRKPQDEIPDWNLISDLINTLEIQNPIEQELKTRLVPGYLIWRYRDNPLFPYQYLSDGESFILVYRIKEGKMGREFRICDFLTTEELSKTQKKELNHTLTKRIKASGARFSSFSGLNYSIQNEIDMGLLPILKIGPMVTLRELANDFSPMTQDWKWSLGDLEVF